MWKTYSEARICKTISVVYLMHVVLVCTHHVHNIVRRPSMRLCIHMYVQEHAAFGRSALCTTWDPL